MEIEDLKEKYTEIYEKIKEQKLVVKDLESLLRPLKEEFKKHNIVVDRNGNFIEDDRYHNGLMEQSRIYNKLAKLSKEIEGELIQDIYFMFLEFPLDKECCDQTDDGQLIPRVEDVYDMQDKFIEMIKERKRQIKKLI